MAKDLISEIVSERSAKNPQFRGMVAEAESRRRIARRLAGKRERKGLSQTVVAARMRTSASVVSKLESGADVKVSTLQRYCAAIGAPFELR